MNHILYNISIKQKRSKQEQKEGKQMLIECPANTRLQDYLLQNDIHIFDGLRRSRKTVQNALSGL